MDFYEFYSLIHALLSTAITPIHRWIWVIAKVTTSNAFTYPLSISKTGLANIVGNNFKVPEGRYRLLMMP